MHKKIHALVLAAAGIVLAMLLVMSGIAHETERVFIRFNGAPDESVAAGGRVLHSYASLPNVLAVEVPRTALAGILRNPRVAGIEFDAQVNTFGKPVAQQPAQTLPWGVDRIDAELSTVLGNGVAVCVVDTGIDKTHPDLASNIIGGKNFVTTGRVRKTNAYDDDNGHGTHVAGTIAALDNAVGVVGVAPQANLLVAKVLNAQGSGYISDVIAGIDYCISTRANVISMSLGSSSDVQALHDAVDRAYAAGAVVVAAAGNDYGGAVSYPAAYSSVIAVSATDSNDVVASFSNVGPKVELAAPGVGIMSTWKGGGYNTISGTSMATPHVSGVAALAIQRYPGYTNVQIRDVMGSTAQDLGVSGRDSQYGFGRVDATLNP